MQRLCILEEEPTPRTMAARPCLLLLCITAIAAGSALKSRAQPDSKGFISIDCGVPGKTGYVDNATKLWQATDAGFTDGAGANHNISVEFINPRLPKRFHNLRSFSDGARNCYTLRSLVSGLKYMVRAAFLYGNYDGLGTPPVFDLYVGVNFWTIVNLTSPEASLILEAAVVVPDSFVQVCLVNTGSGNPLISGLELRPLRNTFYPQVNATQGLFLSSRLNFGTPDGATVLRYPDDPHDRVWIPYAWVGHADSWDVISTTKRMQNIDGDIFGAPAAVMRTAVTPRRNASFGNIEFSWPSEHQPNDPSPGYIVVLHIAELQLLPGNATREFYINMNGELWYAEGYTPAYLRINALYNSYPLRYSNYNVSINATANSTLPPIINAMEVFVVMPTATIATDSVDVSALTAIKTKYLVKRNWMGDPCVPKTLTWDNLSCRHAVSSPPRITSLNLSSSGLNGDISTSFANLTAVENLDLSNNNLSGSIPHALSQLPSLTLLDLSGNQLSGLVPYALVKRIQDGSLKLRYNNNPDLCNDVNSCQPTNTKRNSSSRLAIYIAVPVVLTAVMLSAVLLLLFLLRRRRQGSRTNKTVKPQNDVQGDSSLLLENRRFTYRELETTTNNFERVLGRGGFGYVYDGFLENGTQVAVKLRSDSSNQGVKEFLAEAQILTRVHHKNLVSMIGYCKDGEYMALVYDYMSEGTLQEHIVGREGSMKCLPWRQRLRIALESAQGLEYLHKGCNPPLIHRDVKATNILLNSRLEAKIADFGLSKAFIHDNDTHISTNTLVGTPGYVDPEYQATMQPTTKSDVYSFGVVLLELVAGKPAILRDPDPTSIIQWVQRRLARGNIESVVDSHMGGDHDINSVWKVADIALKCTAYASMQQPTMTDVVIQLQECVEFETGSAGVDMHGTFYTKSYNDDSNSSYNVYSTGDRSDNTDQGNTSFAMEHNLKRVPTMDGMPAAR